MGLSRDTRAGFGVVAHFDNEFGNQLEMSGGNSESGARSQTIIAVYVRPSNVNGTSYQAPVTNAPIGVGDISRGKFSNTFVRNFNTWATANDHIYHEMNTIYILRDSEYHRLVKSGNGKWKSSPRKTGQVPPNTPTG